MSNCEQRSKSLKICNREGKRGYTHPLDTHDPQRITWDGWNLFWLESSLAEGPAFPGGPVLCLCHQPSRPMNAHVIDVLTLTTAWALTWPSQNSASGFPPEITVLSTHCRVPTPQGHTLCQQKPLPSSPLCQQKPHPLPTSLLKKPCYFSEPHAFPWTFISPSALLHVILSPSWLPAAVSASVLGPPSSHICSNGKSPTLRSRINPLLECIDYCLGSQFLPL